MSTSSVGESSTGDQTGRAPAEATPSGLSLEKAAAIAVESSVLELDELEAAVAQVLELLPTYAHPSEAEGDAEEDEVANPLGQLAQSVTTRFTDHFSLQREVLGSFNIVLFGRTGAGKSTLLSALGQLDGSRVSPGDSDWTVDVEPIEWRGCKLYDTPGINGWGRSRSRSELEATARRAVEIADVVILCFDNQGQQASEFEKVASWVGDYGKPVIAVLNIRNDRWRDGERTKDRAGRERLSQAAGEHADHVTEELAFIGLPTVPVVSMNSHRALAARASEPLEGPKAPSILQARARLGQEKLLEMSNFAALEALLVAAIAAGGAQLRLVALREGVRQLLTELRDELGALASEAEAPLNALDRTIKSILDVVGYPELGSRERTDAKALWSEEFSGDLMQIYENSRGAPFTARVRGTLSRHVDHLLNGELAKERALSYKRAEKLVVEAFAKKNEINQTAFEKQVIDRDAIESAVSGVWRDGGRFMQRELAIVIDEGMTEVQNLQAHVDVNGGKGSGTRRVGLGLEIVGVAGSGVMATLAVIGATNVWNPGGWVALAIFGGLTLFSALHTFWGKKSNAKAERQRVQARAQAIADVRRVVSEYFAELRTRLRIQFEMIAAKQSATPLRMSLERALVMRQNLDSIAVVQVGVSENVERIPSSPNAAEVMVSAAATLSVTLGHDTGSNHSTVMSVLRGEDWINGADDRMDSNPPVEHDDRHLFRAQAKRDQERIAAAFTRMWGLLPEEDASKWLEKLTRESLGDADMEDIAACAHSVAQAKPRIVLVGDYSSGKTSLIKRLLVENGLPVPDELTVRGQPTPTATGAFPMRRVDLIDSSGLQSGDLDQDRSALEATTDAALVVVTMHNNLIIGDISMLRTLLLGDATNSAKNARTLFVINRSDGLVGHDPNEDPRAYLRARERRELELMSALESIGVAGESVTIVTIAADPYGAVGDSREVAVADYRHGREWDGVEPLLNAVRDSEDLLLGPALSAASLDGALARLLVLRERHGFVIELLYETNASDERIADTIQSAGRDGELLAKSIEIRVAELLGKNAQKQLRQVLKAVGKSLPAETRQLQHWWTDPTLQNELDQLLSEVTVLMDSWVDDYESLVEREVRVAAARLNDMMSGSGFKARKLKSNTVVSTGARTGLKLSGDAAKILKKHEEFYKVGKLLKFKFKPWGAVKGAKFMAKAGPVLAVAGFALDVTSFINARRADSRREEARLTAMEYIEKSTGEIASLVCRGSDEEPGPVTVIQNTLAEFQRSLAELESRTEEGLAAIRLIESRVNMISGLVSEAVDILSTDKQLEVIRG